MKLFTSRLPVYFLYIYFFFYSKVLVLVSF